MAAKMENKPGKPAEGPKKLLQEHTEALASDENPFAEIDKMMMIH